MRIIYEEGTGESRVPSIVSEEVIGLEEDFFRGGSKYIFGRKLDGFKLSGEQVNLAGLDIVREPLFEKMESFIFDPSPVVSFLTKSLIFVANPLGTIEYGVSVTMLVRVDDGVVVIIDFILFVFFRTLGRVSVVFILV